MRGKDIFPNGVSQCFLPGGLSIFLYFFCLSADKYQEKSGSPEKWKKKD